MRKNLLNIIAGGVLLAAAPAQAGVVTFEELNPGGKLAALSKNTPYQGFTWTGWSVGDNSVAGYGNAAHSGTDFVLNGFGVNNLGISSADPFDFGGAWFVAPNINGARAGWINISAFDSANRLIGSTGNIAIGAAYTFVAAGFSDVSRLNITRDRGWFAMDDLSFSRAAEVPAPNALVLFGLGAALLGWMRRRRG